MRPILMTRRRVASGLVAATLLLAACGGADDDNDAGATEALPEVDAAPESADAGSGSASPEATGSGLVDLVGAEVTPESDFEGNLLPNVVVDDLNTGRKVNFKNLVPQEKPILLWMWAPH